MNEVQELIKTLRNNGWTLAAIADELDVPYTTVYRWVAGVHVPTHLHLVVSMLEQLLQRKRIPKKRRYTRKRRHLTP